MSDETKPPRSDKPTLARRFRRELILAGIMFIVGVGLLPLAIFHVGQELLGDYSTDGAGVLDLYGHILRDLGSGRLIAWVLVLSPWLGIMLLRALWWPLRRREPPPEAAGEV